MATILFTSHRLQSFKADGTVNAGGSIEFFEPDQAYTTNKDTYTTKALSVANGNPITLDAAGKTPNQVFLDGDYDCIVKDSSGTTLSTDANLNPTITVAMLPISSDTTLDSTHDQNTVEVTGTTTLTFSAASALGEGWTTVIKNVGSGVVTLTPDGTDTIEGTNASFTMEPDERVVAQVNDAENGIILGRSTDLLSTKGDLLYASAANQPSTLAIGNSGQVLSVNSAGDTPAYWAPNKYRAGLTLSNDTDTDHDINIIAGEATDSTNAYIIKLTSEITKQIDAAWAVGDDAGGLDGTESVAGTPDASTWYHVYLIYDPTNNIVDAIFSESASAPTLPTNYTVYRWIGAVLTDGSANIIQFTQHGNWFKWNSRIENINTNSPATSRTAIVMSSPLGIVCDVRFQAKLDYNSSDERLMFTDAAGDDVVTTADNSDLAVTSLVSRSVNEVTRTTDTSSQIYYRSSSTNPNSFVVNSLRWTPLGLL